MSSLKSTTGTTGLQATVLRSYRLWALIPQPVQPVCKLLFSDLAGWGPLMQAPWLAGWPPVATRPGFCLRGSCPVPFPIAGGLSGGPAGRRLGSSAAWCPASLSGTLCFQDASMRSWIRVECEQNQEGVNARFTFRLTKSDVSEVECMFF